MEWLVKQMLTVFCVSRLSQRIQKRHLLEDSNQLDARRSALDDDLEEMEEDEEEGEFRVSCFSTCVQFHIHHYC